MHNWQLKFGATRTVILVGRWAIKIPGCYGAGRGWHHFLCGLLANMQEKQFSDAGWPELCPVVFHVPGGFLTVMRRARPLTDDEWATIDPETWGDRDDYVVPVEAKRDSFGIIDGRVVAIDYGS